MLQFLSDCECTSLICVKSNEKITGKNLQSLGQLVVIGFLSISSLQQTAAVSADLLALCSVITFNDV